VLATDDEQGRVAWTRGEILKTLDALTPNSWAAWLYLIGLTTSARIGEITAARVGWFNPRTNMIEVDDPRYTKARKKHVMPIIECLHEPLVKVVQGRDTDEYLFADAPRPSNEKIPISHETSKWFGRYFDRLKIERVFHELRHTWIEEARHSSVERDVWEILSGHSAGTVSDRYGGKKPDVLAAANETVCKFLTSDPEIMAAVHRAMGRSDVSTAIAAE
jgi:integrase